MEDEIRGAGRVDRPDEDRVPLRQPDGRRRPAASPACDRRGRSSSSRPRATSPTPTSSRRSSPSRTTRIGAPEPYHIVAEIRDRANLEVARMVGRDEVELILSEEVISRITAQTCRQSGLSVVYAELLDFAGDEIYLTEQPALVGRTVRRDALAPSPTPRSSGCCPAGGTPQLNPPLGDRDRRGRPADRHRRGRRPDPPVGGASRARSTRRSCAQAADADAAAGADAGPRLEPPSAGDHPRARCLRRRRLRDRRSWPIGAGGRRRRRPARRAALSAQRIVAPDSAMRRDRAMLDALGVETFDHVIVLCYDALDRLAGGCPDARDAAPPARHRVPAGPRLLDRQRDARPARPGAGRGRPGRRLHRQRPAHQPDDRPGRRVQAPQRGLRRPARPGGLGDLPQAGRRLRGARPGGALRRGHRGGPTPRRGRLRLPARRPVPTMRPPPTASPSTRRSRPR